MGLKERSHVTVFTPAAPTLPHMRDPFLTDKLPNSSENVCNEHKAGGSKLQQVDSNQPFCCFHGLINLNALQDGTIQFEAKLTGCLSTSGLSPGEGPLPTHGTLIAPGLNAQIHQHFFCTRLDMSVDDPHGGANLTVSEVCCGVPQTCTCP